MYPDYYRSKVSAILLIDSTVYTHGSSYGPCLSYELFIRDDTTHYMIIIIDQNGSISSGHGPNGAFVKIVSST